ncbi:DUF7475 family protein [Halorubrum sp. DTA98]|uniref:DUF7475 family protein n=1 Tax=Halorubrum sp. DTA98 TaxID=3402163 RepID=UPI003AB099B6
MNRTEDLRSSALTPLHWLGIALAFVTAAVHLVLGVGLLPHWMGLAFFAATAGFLVGIWLVATGRRRRLVYLLGIPFTGTQIILWYLLNDPGSLDALGPADVIDKTAQAALIVVLIALYVREA